MGIYLRALEEEDYTELYKWRNDFGITDLLGGNRFYVSKLREKKWIEEAILNDKTNLHLAICLKEKNHLLGIVNLTNINHLNKKAEFSIMIGDITQQGKGYGKIAAKLMLKHGFEELNLNRIYLTVLNKNVKAIKLYEAIGFLKEGMLRQEIFKNNEFQDMMIMSILRKEFDSL